jgi:hypothetical protein
MTENNTGALGKHEFAALDLMISLPGRTAKVAKRGNAGRGIVSEAIADRLVAAGKAVRVDRTIVHPDEFSGDDQPVEDRIAEKSGRELVASQEGDVDQDPITEPTPEPAAPEPEVTTPEEPPTEHEVPDQAPKVNGRKAKAEASPYSTAPVSGIIKRHGKSRRTGTVTEIEDLLHPKSSTKGQVEGSGRYRVKCLDHDKHSDVPDMTTAKPLQARTDQFCGKCRKAVEAKPTDQTATPAA